MASNVTQFIGSKLKLQSSDRMEDPFILLKGLTANCEMVDMKIEKIIVEVPKSESIIEVRWTPRTHILIHESILEIFQTISPIVSPPATPSVGAIIIHGLSLNEFQNNQLIGRSP